MSSLFVQRIESAEGLVALGREWQWLSTTHGRGLPFSTYEWNSSWWAHFRERRLSVRDRLFIRAIRDQSGELVGVAPLMLTERPSFGFLRARVLQFFGADPNITELRGVICDPARETDVYAALMEELHACAREWDWMIWLGLRDGGEPARMLASQPGFRFVRDIPDFVLSPRGTWEDFKASRPRNIKESLRKCYNSLKRDNHAFTFEVARTRADVAQGMEHFFRLHGARAEVSGTVQHSNVFDSLAARGFLTDLCQRLAERDVARVFMLRIGGQVVATRIGFALGEAMYLYYSGYDPEWAQYSVMTTTVAEAIKYSIGEGFQTINLSTGNDVSKTRWSPEELLYREAFQLSPSPRARLAYATYCKTRELLEDERVRAVSRKLLGRRARAR